MKNEALCTLDLTEFSKDLNFEIFNRGEEKIEIYDAGINRPGLQLHGYYSYFDEKRIQIIGKVEMSYLMGLAPDLRRKRIEDFFSYDFPCFIVCWDLPEVTLFIEAAKKYNRVLLKSSKATAMVFYSLIEYLDRKTAPSTTVHGVLVEVHGVGVLITGESGIGKSETALELLQRGNCMIADDVVDIRKEQDYKLMGSAPEMLRYYMEVRGIGIIDVPKLFGSKAVKKSITVDMILHLEKWSEKANYNRLGLDEETEDVLGVALPKVTVPVSGGRNLAVIIETAAINTRVKMDGFHAAQIFCDTIAAQS